MAPSAERVWRHTSSSQYQSPRLASPTQGYLWYKLGRAARRFSLVLQGAPPVPLTSSALYSAQNWTGIVIEHRLSFLRSNFSSLYVWQLIEYEYPVCGRTVSSWRRTLVLKKCVTCGRLMVLTVRHSRSPAADFKLCAWRCFLVDFIRRFLRVIVSDIYQRWYLPVVRKAADDQAPGIQTLVYTANRL